MFIGGETISDPVKTAESMPNGLLPTDHLERKSVLLLDIRKQDE